MLGQRHSLPLLACFLLLPSLIGIAETTVQGQARQNSFLVWLASIFRPVRPVRPANSTTTTTVEPPPRDCAACTCGTLNTVHRIVGGQETVEHQYPWMAMLLYNGRFYCGAALINDLYVATAAHCVTSFNQALISIRFLEHNRSNSSASVLERRAAWVGAHEQYGMRNYDNDIALIRLNESLVLTDMLRPVCLPATGQSFAGETAIVTGWGALSEGSSGSDTLQEVKVPVLSQAECRSSNYGAKRITENMLCAGYDEGGKDSCQGDSGGPLHVPMAKNSAVYQLAGIVSWGEGCARPRSPGVYARVNRYLDWIGERTRDACSCQIQQTTTTTNCATT